MLNLYEYYIGVQAALLRVHAGIEHLVLLNVLLVCLMLVRIWLSLRWRRQDRTAQSGAPVSPSARLRLLARQYGSHRAILDDREVLPIQVH